MSPTKTGIGLVFAGLLTLGLPLTAQEVALDPSTAAGKELFDISAGDVGCASCHGEQAKGDIGPDIRGRDPVAILDALKGVEEMSFIELSEEQIAAVADYLRYLHDLVAH
jgi:mono/diheme cytochrome c family protein